MNELTLSEDKLAQIYRKISPLLNHIWLSKNQNYEYKNWT